MDKLDLQIMLVASSIVFALIALILPSAQILSFVALATVMYIDKN